MLIFYWYLQLNSIKLFPMHHFKIDGCNAPIRFDHDINDSGAKLYVWELRNEFLLKLIILLD